ncbi:secondary thiamine-phosphate synthase enzyme YjbQ [Prosthecochloris sp. HL-130-GSB]|jgi:secondary thiamine-phosphate synthase enzyme|uniref:secondary thiamine-phosphate synthase enzyme YjbQ n=1 Tax=Prosthecochloris sp. HL-130-GSB TaxID=1974213 RepID=UPI000A1BFFD4|nr:secondary thiamine-phosphate synthase enzyme YjbQ [Prosthecochloris sp. HL-130-GSB]ARM30525.1 secondary thiamine-phosphate synthase enzyme [Prosthecochloris sp. HL-130-GSB]
MHVITRTISRQTKQPITIIDITDEIKQFVEESGITQGQATIISQHTTAFVNINEQEPRLLEDMVTFLKRLVPRDGDYAHNIAPIDGRDNAHSHLMGLFMNTSETIPVQDSRLLLGEWQSIFLIELDGPRPKRNILLQISGK